MAIVSYEFPLNMKTSKYKSCSIFVSTFTTRAPCILPFSLFFQTVQLATSKGKTANKPDYTQAIMVCSLKGAITNKDFRKAR